jgi:hypothetical protein
MLASIHYLINVYAARSLCLALVASAVLCDRVAAMLSDQEVRKLTKNIKVFTYDLAGHGLMPPLETFSMQNPDCQQCAGVRFPQWTECNYGFGIPKRATIAADYQGLLWHGHEDVAVHTHHQLTHSPFATTNATEAQLFFIPIYVLLFDNSRLCERVQLAEYSNFGRLWTWIRAQPSYRKSNGTDHFMMVAHPWSYARGLGPLAAFEPALEQSGLSPDEMSAERAKFARIAKLVVDNDAGNPAKYSGPITAEDDEAPSKALRTLVSEQTQPHRLFQVPYTTAIHYFHGHSPSPESDLLVDSAGMASDKGRLRRHVQHERPVLASYVTTLRADQVLATEFLMVKRKALVLCLAAPDCKVVVVDPGAIDASLKRFVSHINSDSSILSTLGFKGLRDLLESAKEGAEFTYYLSQFCLMPSGDTVSRKGFFDAILMGCIPVVFYPMSAHYPWHLPTGSGPEGLESYAVYIPAKDMLKNHTVVMDHLRSIPKQRVRVMQKKLAALASRIQYAINFGDEPGMNRLGTPGTWGPDALEIILAGLISNVKGD